ncbi:transcription factor A, mitochondrial [Dicentrarchus labrax]|uniref:Transcription factor A, mitochondrial n=1 Tax=Dicentrarchus labrax TaxID=13489 RepID=A0A8C4HV78_DICLA|nr:transcription factor A, mitochondrial [Dicentrarchus labrax]
MATFSLMPVCVSWLAKSFKVLSCTSTLARCTSVLPATYINPVRCLTSQAGDPPKKPLNVFIRYVQQQRPILTRQNPEMKSTDILSKIAQQWRVMSPEQKEPFMEAYVRDMSLFKVELERYWAESTPEMRQKLTLEKMEKSAKIAARRKKLEKGRLGHPKRTRSAVNIYMSEHFEDGRGTTTTEKMGSLMENWKNMPSHEKEVYLQLSQDDHIRYENEMKLWEDHMLEIGRSDLIRKTVRKAAAITKSETSRKTTERSKNVKI